MKYSITLSEAKECQSCMWREKTLDNIVKCPMLSCQKSKVERIQNRQSKGNVRHKQA